MPRLNVLPRLSRTKRAFVSIAFGTVIGQAAFVLVSPALSRLYTPSDFGIFTVVSSLASIFAVVAGLRLEHAVAIPEDAEDANSLVSVSLIAIAACTTIAVIAVWLFGERLAGTYGDPSLTPWLYFVPILGGTSTALLVFNQLALRERRYSAVARRNAARGLIAAAAQLAAGLAGLRPLGLIVGLLAGNISGVAPVAAGSSWLRHGLRQAFRPQRLFAVAKRFIRFPLVLAPAGLINVLGVHGPIILIALFYGDQVAGWLGLTNRTLAGPVTLMATAVGQIFLGELAAAVRSNPRKALDIYRRSLRALSIVAVLMLVFFLPLAPTLFAFIFGEQWRPSGDYARAMVLAVAIQALAAPLSQALILLSKVGLQFAWDIARLIVATAAVLLSYVGGLDALATIWVYAGVSAITYAVSLYLSWAALRRHSTLADTQAEL